MKNTLKSKVKKVFTAGNANIKVSPFVLVDVLENGNCLIKKQKPLYDHETFTDVNGVLVSGREPFEVAADWFDSFNVIWLAVNEGE